MSLLDKLKGTTGATPAAAGSQASLASAALSMLSGNEVGGISGLAESFAAQGLGHIVSSWIGTGQNLPISPQQMQSVLGSERVQALATKAGMQPDQVNSGLAQIMPQLVDHLTPNGQVPAQGDLMSRGMEFLKTRIAA